MIIFDRANDILVLFIYVQKPPFNAHAEISRGARCFISGMNLPCLVYERSDNSGETVPM